jgi:NAD-dependent dihydropyrimidine dehydrogenase PreA subunit
MPVRDIIEIDEEKCNGCGECIPNCAEGALQIIDGKARLIRDDLCDGLGACLGHCPQGALKVIKRDAPDFDEEAVEEHLKQTAQIEVPSCDCAQSCFTDTTHETAPETVKGEKSPSRLRQWPIALRLVPVNAPFFKNADLLITADCVPFAYPEFHEDFLHGKVLIYGCPKFDDAQGYVHKLTEIFQTNTIRSISLVIMEVPCCSGLSRIVERALADSGKTISLETKVIGVKGEIKH